MSPQISPILTTTPTIKEELKKVEQKQAEELLFSNQSTQEINTAEDFQEENQEITFKQGLELFGQGAWNKVKEMGSAIIKHPGKTLLAVGATAAAIAALPLIGISSATGAAALAIGFGVASIFNTGKDVKETIDDYKEGKFDEVREDIQELGGDGVDLAMSLPFMPKAIKQVGRTVKYGTSTIGLNTSLISDLKNVSNLDDVAVAFGKANAKINYEMIGNEAGLAVKPELIFEKMNNKNIVAQFEPTTGKIIYNENALSAKNPTKYLISQDETLRHELKHFEQYTEIARANGPEAVAKTMTEYYTKILKKAQSNSTELTEYLKNQDLNPDTVKNMTSGDKSTFNQGFWDDVVASKGSTSSNPEAITKANEYAKAAVEKVEIPETTIKNAAKKYNVKTTFKNETERKAHEIVYEAEIKKFKQEVYASNLLEKEAYAIGREFAANNFQLNEAITPVSGFSISQAQETFSEDDVSLKDAWWGAFVSPIMWSKFKNTGEKSLTVSEVFKIAVEDKGTPWSIVGKLRELFQ